jgi:hypothetical protein
MCLNQRWRAEIRVRHVCVPNTRKLGQVEEEVIFIHIIDLNIRGFLPTYALLRDIADRLLAACGAGQVRQKWPANLVKRTDSLTTSFNRA